MSYQVLARKWRPQGFDEVTGQSHVTTPLRNAIKSGRVPHAVLLTGPRGVGKTTLARILARCLNCDEGPTDAPCGSCGPCEEIAAGTSTDVQEIDAASRTSVDDVRELIASIRYAAAPGKYRIFVVDEVHMLSAAAFNALLKTLEEPPPSSLFVFATTNPEKIPFTVVSRCQRYDLRRFNGSEIVDRLRVICAAEDVKISDGSLLAIGREADGSMRDAQTLLDQVIAYGGSEIDDAQVAEVLDLIDRRLLLAIADACISEDPARALEACAEAGAAGADAKRLGENLLQLLRDLVVLSIAPDRDGLVEASSEEVEELRALAARSDTTRLRRMFRALVKEQEDLAWAPRPFAVLELAVVRLATLPPADDVARLLARLEALERQLAGGGSGGGGAPPAPAPGSGKAASRGSGSSSARQARPTAAAPPGAEAASPAPAAPASVGRDAPLPMVFDRLRARAREAHPGVYAALEGASLLSRDADELVLRVSERFSASRLREKAEILDRVASDLFGRATRVRIDEAEQRPAASGAAADPEADRQRRANALNDPGVGRALEILGGDIVDIRPLGSSQ
jgi:DNA polymerase-3 subunit gamma/tau